MATTSVHFPEDLLDEIGRRAKEVGMSRNRFIIESCRAMLSGARRQWPADFFSPTRLNAAEVVELRTSAAEFMNSIVAARRSRRKPPF